MHTTIEHFLANDTEDSAKIRRDEPVNMWGMDWTQVKVLCEMHKPDIHHHGQMTVSVRQAGLKVHGLCARAWLKQELVKLARKCRLTNPGTITILLFSTRRNACFAS